MTTPAASQTPSTDAGSSSTGEQHEARLGDRGAASGRNIAQNRAIGQDDPLEGSRMGREQHKAKGFPGDGEPGSGEGTDAAQTREAKD
jgi:hypothetical protein